MSGCLPVGSGCTRLLCCNKIQAVGARAMMERNPWYMSRAPIQSSSPLPGTYLLRDQLLHGFKAAQFALHIPRLLALELLDLKQCGVGGLEGIAP